MVEQFFPLTQSIEPESIGPLILLSGPICCGKTSLLFQFAINCALDSSSEVVFICNKGKLESKPPFLSEAIDPSSDVFERIQMKYVEDYEDIKKYFSAFHLHVRFPSAVIIDDFGGFFNDRYCQQKYGNARGRDLAMVRTLSLCQDAVSHANRKLQPHKSCTILLSDLQQGDSPQLLFIYRRLIKCFFTIEGNQGDGSGSYKLKKNKSILGCGEGSRVAKYNIALQYLVLEDIIEE
ncbi:tRNA dimethylallyltransferase [Rhynchospora pubera]|uniref:tRNA dimethylallyltransferase n=1 Tax=Rhynchospora pubera TaxID=906938 RepID=A0AAV8G194_9POAL|nr:tRNA dimethylallyltransferase [Rhynchospora pubera]